MSLHLKLLAAFAQEHVELLGKIRQVLRAHTQAGAPHPPDWAEAYRAAHSLKGAARVCDLAGLQEVGAALEKLFGKVRDGEKQLPADAAPRLEGVLNQIGEAANAGAAQAPLPDLTAAVSVIQDLLSGKAPAPMAPAPKAGGLSERLLAAFEVEHAEHLEEIRLILNHPTGLKTAQMDEIFRRAHSLKGASRVNKLTLIEQLAHHLESLFNDVRQGKKTLDPATRQIIGEALDAIEDSAAAAIARQPVAETSPALDRLQAFMNAAPMPITMEEPVAPIEPEEEEAGPSLADSIRVDATALDRILDTAGQLTSYSFHQDGLDRQIKSVARGAGKLHRKLETVRRRETAISRDELSWLEQELKEISQQLRAVQRQRTAGGRTLNRLARQLQENTRRARFVPALSVFTGFRKMARDLAREIGKKVQLQVHGLEEEADRVVLQALKDPLTHLIRNAIDHGIETPEERRRKGKPEAGGIELRIVAGSNQLTLEIQDDGAGINYPRVKEIALQRGILSPETAGTITNEDLAKLLFDPHFSTSRTITEVSGRGVGLSVVRTAARRLQGEATVLSPETGGTLFRVTAPLSLATQRLLLLQAEGREFGLPVGGVSQLLQASRTDVSLLEGMPRLRLGNRSIPLVNLHHLLHFGSRQAKLEGERFPVAVIKAGDSLLGLLVDSFHGVKDSIVKDLPKPAAVNPCAGGAILTEEGTITLVLNPAELLERFATAPPVAGSAPVVLKKEAPRPKKERHTVLVVDDSFTTRTLEKSVLEANGYDVVIAVDGLDGLQRLQAERERIDLAIIDVEMPRMDGFTLLGEIKKDPLLRSKPVVMVTSLESREHIERGLNLGAEAYIVKRKFDHQELLQVVEQNLEILPS